MAPRPLIRYPRIIALSLAATLLAVAPIGAQTGGAQPGGSVAHEPLQRMVDDLNMQIGLTFRGRPVLHDERYEQLRAALDAWNRSARSDRDYAVMTGWLAEATRASMPGARLRMPGPPSFGSVPAVVRPPVTRSPVASRRPTPETLPPGGGAQPLSRPPARPPVASSEDSPRPTAPRQATRPEPQQLADVPDLQSLFPETTTEPNPPSNPSVSSPTIPPPARTPVATTPPVFADPIELPPDEEPAPSFQAPRAVAAQPTQPAAPRAATEAAAPPLQQHPSAAALGWGDPFVDDPLPSDAMRADRPEASLAGMETLRRTTRFRPTGRFDSTVKVNLSELSSQIRGYARGLDFVEAELIATPRPSAFRLAGLTRELEALASQRGMLELYLTGLDEIERMALEDLPAPTEAIRLIAERAESRRAALDGGDSDAAEAERAVLAGLELKLQELTEGAGR